MLLVTGKAELSHLAVTYNPFSMGTQVYLNETPIKQLEDGMRDILDNLTEVLDVVSNR